jgi:hypothetical protein
VAGKLVMLSAHVAGTESCWRGDLQLATGSLHVNEKLGSLHLELTRFQELGGFFSLGMSHDSKA